MPHPVRWSASAGTAVLAVLAFLFGTAAPAHAAPPPPPSVAEARDQLAALTVEAESSSSSYDRDLFPHWSAVEGTCNTRETVLRRDGSGVEVGSDCYPDAGSWTSPYDGVTTSVPSQVSIDHMVALAEAWASGADTWSTARREDFANDLSSPQLWAVSATSNSSKGDRDPAEWLPPRSQVHCDYARSWINVKYVWDLSVDSAERAALGDLLDSAC
ncbi:HNH endonuclease family protein [Streptomonospora sp. S1-112]|uniref:HNH endonuclease family protein n=1 Tax=Streptomonospora mangrovi TaxID=2883123 RepID=A0A9X3P0D1_9ACTN|nr:HNH endonuclease family protein [Streptomonospora mangrovi]MDA0567546.1 HNH endonuclease family protein [Streptomonospora mangrovi]